MRTNSDQVENMLEIEIILKNKLHKYFGVEKYNNTNEKFRRGVQQQNRVGRIKN